MTFEGKATLQTNNISAPRSLFSFEEIEAEVDLKMGEIDSELENSDTWTLASTAEIEAEMQRALMEEATESKPLPGQSLPSFDEIEAEMDLEVGEIIPELENCETWTLASAAEIEAEMARALMEEATEPKLLPLQAPPSLDDTKAEVEQVGENKLEKKTQVLEPIRAWSQAAHVIGNEFSQLFGSQSPVKLQEMEAEMARKAEEMELFGLISPDSSPKPKKRKIKRKDYSATFLELFGSSSPVKRKRRSKDRDENPAKKPRVLEVDVVTPPTISSDLPLIAEQQQVMVKCSVTLPARPPTPRCFLDRCDENDPGWQTWFEIPFEDPQKEDAARRISKYYDELFGV